MNTKLPFKLSSIGLIGLLISQGAYAQTFPSSAPTTGSDLTIEAQGTTASTAPPGALTNAEGYPLFLIENGVTEYIVPTSDQIAYIANLFGVADTLAAVSGTFHTPANLTGSETTLGALGLDAAVVAAAITPGGAITSSSNIASLVSGQLVNNGTPVSSSVSASVQSQVNGADGASFSVGPGNTVSAAATGNAQTLKQTLANGEGSAAVGLSDININGSNVSASLTSSSVGVQTSNNFTGTVNVSGNTASAIAYGSNSSASLIANGASSLSGSDVAGVSSFGSYPTAPDAGSNLVLSGNLLVGGLQALQDSNVTAVNGGLGSGSTGVGTVVGLSTGPSDAPTVGLSSLNVSGNTVSSSANGNTLALSANESLGGYDKNLAVGSAQTVTRGNVYAGASNANIGASQSDNSGYLYLLDSPLTVSSNQLTAQALGNTVTTSVIADQSSPSDGLAVSNAQYFQGGSQSGTPAFSGGTVIGVVAEVQNDTLGMVGQQASGSPITVSGNTLSSLAAANEQASSVQTGPGSVSGANGVNTAVTQTVLANGGPLLINAFSGGNILGYDDAAIYFGRSLLNSSPVSSSPITVSGNQLSETALGNDASQLQAALSGTVSSPISTSVVQNTGSINGGNLAINSFDSNSVLGVQSTSDLSAPLTVSNNTLSALAVANRESQVQQAISGSVSGSISAASSQSDTGTYVTAGVSDALGVGYFAAGSIASNADAPVLVSGNTVQALANVNQATFTAAGLDGELIGSGAVTTSLQQQATDSGVDSGLGSQLGIGSFFGSTIGGGSSAASLQVSGNSLNATAAANSAAVTIGAQTGTVGADAILGAPLGMATATQTATGVFAQSIISSNVLGLSTAAVLGNASGASLFQVSNNSVSATARQNIYSETDGGTDAAGHLLAGTAFNGSLLGGGGSILTQTTSGGFVEAEDANLQGPPNVIGITLSSAIGTSSDGTVVTVSNNLNRTDAASNVASQVLAGVIGTIGSATGSNYGGTAAQSAGSGGSPDNVEADTANIDFGLNTISSTGGASGSVGAGGALSLSVTGNEAVTVATGNAASQSLGGVSGQVGVPVSSVPTTVGTALTQGFNGHVTTTSGNITIGSTTGDVAPAGGFPVTQTIIGNSVLTGANGNSATQDLGTINGTLFGLAGTAVNQAIVDGSTLGATGGSYYGQTLIGSGFTSLGEGAAAALTVSGNQVSTSVNGNSASSSVGLQGQLSGALVQTEAQTIGSATGAATSLTALTGGAQIGVINSPSGVVGPDASLTVSGNTVSAGVTGNSINDQTVVSATGGSGVVSLGTGVPALASSYLNGSPGQSVSYTTLNATVGDTNVGFGVTSATAPSATVNGNQLVATAVSNQSIRQVSLSGSLVEPAGLNVGDSQQNQDVAVSANVGGAFIGGSVSGGAMLPLNLVASNNVVLAEAAGNSVTQTVSLNGLSLGGGAMTSLTALQSNTGGSIISSVAGVQIGLSAGSLATGSAVGSGNTVGATAIGNQASLTRH